MENKNDKQTFKLSFAAIGKNLSDNIISPTEIEDKKAEYVIWGDGNQYPKYLEYLSENSYSLKSCVEAFVRYAVGNGATITIPQFQEELNQRGETISDIVEQIARSYAIYGGFALNILRNAFGKISEIYVMDFKNIRSDYNNEMFYISKDWSKSYGRVKTICLPKFDVEATDVPSSIFYYNNSFNTTYPKPCYAASTIACDIETRVSEFHLNTLANSFSSNYLVNFCNGTPNQEQQLEIEEMFNEKFCGTENSGRVVISYSDSKDNAPIIEEFGGSSDFVDKYNSLITNSKEQILSAFQINPLLLGSANLATGFSTNEFSDSFKLYNRIVAVPFQNVIKRTFNKLFGDECVTIKTFTIDFE